MKDGERTVKVNERTVPYRAVSVLYNVDLSAELPFHRHMLALQR